MREIFSLTLLVGISIHWFIGFYIFKKKTGINPKVSSDKQTSANKFIVKVITYTFTSVAVFSLLYSVTPKILQWGIIKSLHKNGLSMLGFIIGLIGVIIMQKGQFDIGESWRIGFDVNAKTQLMKGGIYKYTRNPMYLGMIIVLCGFFLVIPHIVTLVLLIVIWIAVNIQARLEEDYLSKVHKESYTDYVKNTGRFIPKV